MTHAAFILLTAVSCLVAAQITKAQYFENEDDQPGDILDSIDLLRNYIRKQGATNRREADEFENWTGRWMPDQPSAGATPLQGKVFPTVQENDGEIEGNSRKPLHGVRMGQPSPDCDDAKTNLTVDWNRSPVNYTCYDQKIVPSKDIEPSGYCERISRHYVAIHECMYQRIEYEQDVPLFGPHRPLWPVYGEYRFLPKQRWLHSLEHGAIVMLYHPCANPLEIKRLKTLVTSCLRRHIISPYNLLPEDRPLALLSWGCRLTMSYVNPALVTRYIREHALHGPEEIPNDGHFDDELIIPARTVSDDQDSTLCPNEYRP